MNEVKNKKQQIFEAAARLFRDKGYMATSMRDLAKAVDLKASSLYNHIQSKEEILQGICFENAKRFREGMVTIESQPIAAADKVKALIALHIEIATQDITSITAFNDEWRHLSGPYLRDFLELRRDYEGRFQQIITDGIDSGEFRAGDPTITLYTLFSAIRWIYDWFKSGRAINQEQLTEEITTLLLEGIKK